MLWSRPGPQATETMGSGRGKGRVTPFLTCPLRTRAPTALLPLADSRGSRNSPLSKGGVSGPFFSAVARQGASPGSPCHALHHPLASIQPPPLETRCAPRRAGNPGTECATRPALRCVSGTPSARTPPPPHRRGATAHVSPLAQSGLSLGRPEPEDPERVGRSRGKGPGRIHFPLPTGRGEGRSPLPRCSLPQARSGNYPLPAPG